MRGSIREIDLGCDRAVRINGREQVWTTSCEPWGSGVCCFDCYRGLFMFGKISFLLKGDTCAPVRLCVEMYKVQVLSPVLGGGEGLKLRIVFKVLLF